MIDTRKANQLLSETIRLNAEVFLEAYKAHQEYEEAMIANSPTR